MYTFRSKISRDRGHLRHTNETQGTHMTPQEFRGFCCCKNKMYSGSFNARMLRELCFLEVNQETPKMIKVQVQSI